MKHIKQDFSLKAWVGSRGVDLGGGAEAKIFFSEYGHVASQIKAYDACSNMVPKLLPSHTLYPGGGVKRSTYILFRK